MCVPPRTQPRPGHPQDGVGQPRQSGHPVRRGQDTLDPGSPEPLPLVDRRAPVGAHGQQPSEHEGVLHRQRGALGPDGADGVGGVAEDEHRPVVPARRPDLLDRRVVRRVGGRQGPRDRVRHPAREAGEGGRQPARVLTHPIAAVGGRVGVHRAPRHRDHQEGVAPAGPRGPAADPSVVGRHEPPARGRHHRRRRLDRRHGRPHDRVDPVGTDHEVVGVGRAVGETHLGAPPGRLHRRDRDPTTDVETLGQGVDEHPATYAHRRRHLRPEPTLVHREEQAVVGGAVLPPGDRNSGRLDGCGRTQLTQRPDGVARQVQAEAGSGLGRPSLDQRHVEAGPHHRAGRRGSGDTRADHQDPAGHQEVGMFLFTCQRFSGSYRRLVSTRRGKFSPYAASTRSSPSSSISMLT